MSTVKTDLIQNVAGNNPPIVTKGAFIRTFCTCSDTCLIQISMNTSSVTDTGVGSAQFNFASLFLTHSCPTLTGTANNQNAPGWATQNVQVVTFTSAWVAADSWLGLHVCGTLA